MSAASNYLEGKIINLVLRGQTFTPPSAIYIALHDGDPGETGANEVTTGNWPSYVRKDSRDGDTLANAWSDEGDGSSKNQKQLIFPVFDGGSAITVTHFSLWDAASGGNNLINKALETPRQIAPGQVYVVDIEKLTITVL